jgi:hypothetical protein
MDKDGNGVLEIDDIKGVYDASRHPDVKSGKKSEDEVLKEFLETFEMNHNVMHGYGSDGVVTQEEFMEYYNNVSVNIDNDQYFDLMMTNAWNLDGKNSSASSQPFAGASSKVYAISSRQAWKNDHHRDLFGNDKPSTAASGAGARRGGA